ncbi:MAG: hypothetical protein ACLR76_03220 [Alistipes sp.]
MSFIEGHTAFGIVSAWQAWGRTASPCAAGSVEMSGAGKSRLSFFIFPYRLFFANEGNVAFA